MSLTPINANSGAVTAIAGDALVLALASGGGYAPVSFADLAKAVRDSISIGGRNLLLNRAAITGGNISVSDGKVTFLANKDSHFVVPYADYSLIQAGKVYTLSFDCEGMVEGNSWTMCGKQNSNLFTIPMVNGRNVVTFVMNGIQASVAAGFSFDDGGRILPNGFAPITLSNFQLEEGNMATAFNLAPEEWGGVIGYLPITYAFGEKGGAHERESSQFSRLLQGPADGIVSCESFRALEEFVGRACSVESAGADFSMSDMLGCERGYSRMDEDKCGYLESPVRGEQIGWVHPYTPVRFQRKDSVLPSLGRDRGSVDICQEAYLGKLRGRFLAGMVSDVKAGKEVAV